MRNMDTLASKIGG